MLPVRRPGIRLGHPPEQSIQWTGGGEGSGAKSKRAAGRTAALALCLFPLSLLSLSSLLSLCKRTVELDEALAGLGVRHGDGRLLWCAPSGQDRGVGGAGEGACEWWWGGGNGGERLLLLLLP